MNTPERVYRDAQKSSGLKLGDYVRIVDADLYANSGWGGIWNHQKQATIGRVGEIWSITDNNIVVLFHDMPIAYDYPYFMLQKVEKPEYHFKPFDRVLVRNREDDPWEPDIFRFYGSKGGLLDDPDMPFYCMADCWGQCIPYEGNEHLVGTTDNPE